MGRYATAARWYDTLSLERPLYRQGRVMAVEALRLEPGMRVLDVGCGTGLSLPVLTAEVGEAGRVVGVDRSEQMLERASARVAEAHWTQVDLVRAPAGRGAVHGTFDAALLAYSLSVVDDWQAVWRWALTTVRAGGRIAVLDTTWPTGWARLLSPAAAVLFAVGGVHPRRRVWRAPLRELDDASTATSCAGHVRLGAGTVRS